MEGIFSGLSSELDRAIPLPKAQNAIDLYTAWRRRLLLQMPLVRPGGGHSDAGV